ncbi:hypothetical protein F383_30069 [Gossypium arboreum]|uniref:Uncharacterized protein n=1 Tax=Gossypium arboreum TaxID=29729 RepID=A0A0B0MYE3_GOSAR|nr:hypothetical protein F383_30069 [Gossypium arboreum]
MSNPLISNIGRI